MIKITVELWYYIIYIAAGLLFIILVDRIFSHLNKRHESLVQNFLRRHRHGRHYLDAPSNEHKKKNKNAH